MAEPTEAGSGTHTAGPGLLGPGPSHEPAAAHHSSTPPGPTDAPDHQSHGLPGPDGVDTTDTRETILPAIRQQSEDDSDSVGGPSTFSVALSVDARDDTDSALGDVSRP
jgi:hypothetical protein